MAIHVIGVTGLPGSGKGELINILRSILSEKGGSLIYFSLSDEVREEARQQGLPADRPTLHRIANEMRLKYGNQALAQRLYEENRTSFVSTGEDAGNCILIVDGIRTPEEVTFFRQRLGERFSLIAITAPEAVLVERISSRSRYDEVAAVVADATMAKELLARESGQGEPVHGLNIRGTLTLADWVIDNSYGIQELRNRVQTLEAQLSTRIAKEAN